MKLMLSLYLCTRRTDYYMISYNCGEFISSFVFQLKHPHSSDIEKIESRVKLPAHTELMYLL